ncbi:MAG: hypothetical protein WDN00_03450 [Limisphaerales bacterium]
MGNVLEFALGLKSAEFLSELGLSARELLSFAAIAEGAHFAIEKLGSAIERGGNLDDLSARTGESVYNLYQLEEAFKAVGLSAGQVDPTIQRVRKALSGVNEMGGNTDSVFAALGLDRASLSQEDPISVIQNIAAALAKLNPNNAAGAANAIFGRNGAGDMLQIANSAEDFAEGLRRSATEAALFSTNAKTFNAIGREMTIIKSHINGFWAGLAAGLAPEILKIEQQFGNIDFTSIGTGVATAIQRGKFTELITLGLEAGFEQAGYYGTRVFQSVAVGFGDALTAALAAVFLDMGKLSATGLANSAAMGVAKFYKEDALDRAKIATRSAAGINDPVQKADYQAQAAEWMQKASVQDGTIDALASQTEAATKAAVRTGVKRMFDGIEQGIKDGVADFNSTGGKRPHEKLDLFNHFMEGLKSAGGPPAPAQAIGSGSGVGAGVGGYTPQVTDLEKIGFIFGNGNGGNDFARRSADAAEMTVEQLVNLNANITMVLSAATYREPVNR